MLYSLHKPKELGRLLMDPLLKLLYPGEVVNIFILKIAAGEGKGQIKGKMS